MRRLVRVFVSSAILVALAACTGACRHEPVASSTSGAPLVAVPVTAARYPVAERVVAIGDLHGDLDATRAALRLAGAIDEADHWIGGTLVVVQTGDEVDRGDHEREILDLFDRLSEEAKATGGAVHPLLGNHEIINTHGDFRSASAAGLRAFADVTATPKGIERFGEGERGRAAAFLPGGAYAVRLARRDVVAIVGDTVFVHAGVLPKHVTYGLDRINAEIREWVAGRTPTPPAVLEKDGSPQWTRNYGKPEVSPEHCRELAEVLAALGARRMVVGHTIQDEGITSACGGQVWRIDVGFFKYAGKKPAQILEIRGDAVNVLTARR